MTTPKLACPQCGNERFEVSAQPKTTNDFIGAPCANCGRRITEDDLKAQATALIEDLVKQRLKGIKGLKLD